MLFRRILSLATWITVEPVQVIDYKLYRIIGLCFSLNKAMFKLVWFIKIIVLIKKASSWAFSVCSSELLSKWGV